MMDLIVQYWKGKSNTTKGIVHASLLFIAVCIIIGAFGGWEGIAGFAVFTVFMLLMFGFLTWASHIAELFGEKK